jgi:putative acetyltransferase
MSGKLAQSVSIEIVQVAAPTDEVRALVAELDGELSGLYQPEQRHGLALHTIFQPHIRFFIARVNGEPAGCGGVALFSDFAEIKRMYVRKQSRGQGIADAVLETLCAVARHEGFTLVRLETGVHSLEAIRFYRRNGFTPCASFEPYTSMPPASIATSVFMERLLA